MNRLFSICFLVPVIASAAIAPSCGDSPTDSGPIAFAVFSAPGFACQQQDKAYTDFVFDHLPSNTSLRLTYNNVADYDFHTVSFGGNFQTAFSLSYTITIDRHLNPTAAIDLVVAGLSSSIPLGNPTLHKLLQTVDLVNLGTTITSRTTPGIPLVVNQTALRVTDTYIPNGGVATLIGSTFRQDLYAIPENPIPEPPPLALAGGALLFLGLLRTRRVLDT